MKGSNKFCTYELGLLVLLSLMNTGVLAGCPVMDPPPNKEADLLEELLCNYDKNDRPVKNRNNTINVTLDILPIHLSVEQNSAGNFVTVSSWILIGWRDEFLSWENRSEYSDVYTIPVSSDKIWLPQVILFNSGVVHPAQMHTFATECMVTTEGEVTCLPHAMNKAFCEMDLSKWPYDTQKCSLIFRVWLHFETTVNLTYLYIDFDEDSDTTEIQVSEPFNEENPYWHLEQLEVREDRQDFGNPGIVFTFHIRRHNALLDAFIVGPAIAMICMTLVSLVLENDCVDRISLLGVSLLSHVMYLQQLSWIVPASGDRCPLVVLFFRDSTLITILVLLATSVLRHNIWSARWLDSMTKVIYTVPGKIIMFQGFARDDLTEIVGEEAAETEDQVPKVSEQATQKKIQLFKKFANRLLFLLIAITYFGLCMSLLVGLNNSES